MRPAISDSLANLSRIPHPNAAARAAPRAVQTQWRLRLGDGAGRPIFTYRIAFWIRLRSTSPIPHAQEKGHARTLRQQIQYELRAEINELRNELWNEQIAHRKTKDAFHRAISKIVRLEAKIQRMEQKARELLTEAQEPVGERSEAA